jgi:hypothetical protein
MKLYINCVDIELLGTTYRDYVTFAINECINLLMSPVCRLPSGVIMTQSKATALRHFPFPLVIATSSNDDRARLIDRRRHTNISTKQAFQHQ